MPFIKEERRVPALNGELTDVQPGDLCFLEYHKIKEAWRTSRRWTTVHNEFKRMFGTDDTQTAKVLAFLEFYIREAHSYEREKVEENGDI